MRPWEGRPGEGVVVEEDEAQRMERTYGSVASKFMA